MIFRCIEVGLKKTFLNSKFVAYLIFISFPCIIFSILFFLNNTDDLSITNIVPTLSDEFGWYKQVEAILNFGGPQGYNGYNGTHAPLGTFGPWGIPILLPFTLFGTVFGWHFYSPVLANLFYLSIANALFLYMTKPDLRQTKFLIGVFALLLPLHFYILIAMAECVRTSLCIILCGMLYKFYHQDHVRFHGIILIVIMLFSQAFLPFILLIPLYFLCMPSKRLNSAHKIGIGLACAILVGAISLFLTSLTASPYPENFFNSLNSIIQSEGVYRGITYLFQNFCTQMRHVDITTSILQCGDLWGSFMLSFWILVIAFLYQLIRPLVRFKCPLNRDAMLSIYILLGAAFAYGTFYALGGDMSRIGRGMMVFLIFVLYYNAMRINWRPLFPWIISSLAGIFVFLNAFSSFFHQQVMTSENIQELLDSQQKIESLLPLSSDRWSNTIAHYSRCDRSLLTLPKGYGENYMLDNSVCQEAGYFYIPQSAPQEFMINMTQEFEKQGVFLIYEDKFGKLFSRMEEKHDPI